MFWWLVLGSALSNSNVPNVVIDSLPPGAVYVIEETQSYIYRCKTEYTERFHVGRLGDNFKDAVEMTRNELRVFEDKTYMFVNTNCTCHYGRINDSYVDRTYKSAFSGKCSITCYRFIPLEDGRLDRYGRTLDERASFEANSCHSKEHMFDYVK